MRIALGIPVQLASALLAADRVVRARPRRVGTWPVSCQEPSRSPAADPGRDESTRAAVDAVVTARSEYRRNSGEEIKRAARVTTRRAVRRRSRARTRAGAGRVPFRDAGMPSVLRKHLIDSSWLTLAGD